MRIQWMGLLVMLSALLGSASGCGGEDLGECPANSDAQQAEGKQVIAQNCTTCHSSQLTGAARGGAPAEYNFDNTALVRDEAEEIYSATESGSMPPVGALSDSQVEAVRVYLACGAK